MKNRLAMCKETREPCSHNCRQGRNCAQAAHTLQTGFAWGVAIPVAITLLLTVLLLAICCMELAELLQV